MAWPQVLSGMLLRTGLRWRLGGLLTCDIQLGAPIRRDCPTTDREPDRASARKSSMLPSVKTRARLASIPAISDVLINIVDYMQPAPRARHCGSYLW